MGSWGGFSAPFSKLWGKREGLNLKSIRPARLKYVLAYTFELLFYAYHSVWLESGATLFGISQSMLMYIGHIAMSLVIMLLWSAKFRRLIHISLAVTLAGFAAFLFVPTGIPKLVCAVLTMAGLGGCVTSARCGFAFAANNPERLLGVVLALGGRAAMKFVDIIFPDGQFWDDFFFYYAFPILFLAGLAVCLLRFKQADLEVKEQASVEDKRGLYWAFAIFIAYFAIEGYTIHMLNTSYAPRALLRAMGEIIAIALFVLVLFFLKKNIWHIWNVFFAVCIVTAVFAALPRPPFLEGPIHILLGVFDVGWIAALYMLGCAQRQFASYKLLKQCTVVFVIVSPLTTLSDEWIESLFPEAVPIAMLVLVLVLSIAFLFTTPLSYKHLFSAAWIGGLHQSDMNLLQEKVEAADRFAAYNLTPREKEVAALLLAAYTIRMVAGELKISPPTANMHKNNLYRKLGISSKAELFRKFGVPSQGMAEE